MVGLMSLNEYTFLLDNAKDLVNAELKERFEKGEIKSPYEIFYEPTYLDVIQIFNYSLPYWTSDIPVNQALRDLISLIDVRNISAPVAKEALRLIAAYIINTESIYYWSGSNGVQLRRLLHKHYGLDKPLNYDYLRYVLNYDIIITKGVETSLTV